MRRFVASAVTVLLAIGSLVAVQAASANPLSVSVDGGSKSMYSSNTTRKMVVDASGDIFLLYTGSTGNHVAKSTNGGVSFSTSSATVSPAVDAEIAVSSNGNLFVTYVESGTIKQRKSTDAGANWSAPVTVGTSAQTSVHTAVDREYVYVIPRNGQKVFSSSDNGSTWVEASLSSTSWAYSDLAVDPLTGVIYPFVDRPQVSWFASNDRGLTFSSERVTGKSVFYSVAALGSNASTKYLYMAGGGSNLERLNLSNNQVTTTTVLDPTAEQSRTIAADGFGNVITAGHVSGVLKFQVSQDYGATFGSETTVVSGLGGSDYSSLAINPLNGDVLISYATGGNVTFVKYSNLLVGYDLSLDVSYVDFSSAGTTQLLVSNTSQASITINTVELSNGTFTQTNTCTSALAPSATCTISVTASTAGSATLRIAASGGIERIIPVAFGASPATVAAPAFTSAEEVVKSDPFKYVGPEFNDPGATARLAGASITLEGKRLDIIKSISLKGSTLSFKVESDKAITITLPSSLTPGKYDLEVLSVHGKLTHIEAIWIKPIIETKILEFKSPGSWLNYLELLELTKIAKKIGSEYTSIKCIVNTPEIKLAERLVKRACSYLESNRLRGKTITTEARNNFKGDGFWFKIVANG